MLLLPKPLPLPEDQTSKSHDAADKMHLEAITTLNDEAWAGEYVKQATKDEDLPWEDPGLLWSVSRTLLRGLVLAVHIPVPKPKAGTASSKMKDAAALRRHRCTCTVKGHSFRLHLERMNVEMDGHVPASFVSPSVPDGGFSFETDWRMFLELFDLRRALDLGGGVLRGKPSAQLSWKHMHPKTAPIFFRVSEDKTALEIVYGTTRLNLPLRMCAAPKPALSEAFAGRTGTPIEAVSLADAIRRINDVEKPTMPCVMENHRVLGGSLRSPVEQKAQSLGEGIFSIMPKQIDVATSAIRRLGSATLYVIESSQYIANGRFTAAVSVADKSSGDFDALAARINDDSITVAPEETSSLVNRLRFLMAMEIIPPRAQLNLVPAPHLLLHANKTTYNHDGKVKKSEALRAVVPMRIVRRQGAPGKVAFEVTQIMADAILSAPLDSHVELTITTKYDAMTVRITGGAYDSRRILKFEPISFNSELCAPELSTSRISVEHAESAGTNHDIVAPISIGDGGLHTCNPPENIASTEEISGACPTDPEASTSAVAIEDPVPIATED